MQNDIPTGAVDGAEMIGEGADVRALGADADDAIIELVHVAEPPRSTATGR